MELGEVIRIEDVNPDFTSPYRESHVHNESANLSESSQAIDPGAIAVNGAVQVTFRIINKDAKEAT